jgi:hypothetical protein
MNITRTTLTWFRQKTEPRWASQLVAKEIKTSIDEVINSQSGYGKDIDRHFVAHNLMTLIRGNRKQGKDILVLLQNLENDPGTIIQPQKRSAFARKWAKRLQKQRGDTTK